MKLGEAIEKANKIKPNRYGDDVLASWLCDLDGRCALETMQAQTAPEYAWPEDADRDLQIPPPYDRVYPLYLVAMIDFHNREMDSYQNDMVAFNAALKEWMAWHRRSHLPNQSGGYTHFLP
jgi:hypothetical protein